jgi:AAHS family 4-hydroxybenzoate transporter-like MFS transporter
MLPVLQDHEALPLTSSSAEDITRDSMQDSINVDELLDRQQLNPFFVTVVCLTTLALVVDAFDASSLAFAVSPLSKELGLAASAFGNVFGISLVGYLLGSLLIGPIGDLFGRKQAVVLAATWTGLAALATAFAHTLPSLYAVRFLAGIGIGAMAPAAIVLASDFVPRRWVGPMVLINGCGVPIGTMLAGLAAGSLIPSLGWPTLFILGGAATLLLAGLIARLPPAPRRLVAQGADASQIARTLRRITGEPIVAGTFVLNRNDHRRKFSFRELLRGKFVWLTPLLWLSFVLISLVIWFMYSWLPTLLESDGNSQSNAAYVATLFSLGGIAGLLSLTPLINRFGATVLAAAAVVGVLVIACLEPLKLIGLQFPALFISGAACSMLQSGVLALAATAYPDNCRSCGVSWLMGVGKIGAILGPVLGGLIVGVQLPLSQIYMLAAAPLALLFLCFVVLIHRDKKVLPALV